MSSTLDAAQCSALLAFDAEQRYQYFIKQVIAHQQIWLLVDEHGCVMLNSDDEDCVPVWPHKELAQCWATEEWAHCKVEAVSVAKWRSRWTSGLTQDDLAIAVFPDSHGEGVVISPIQLDSDISSKTKKG